jgi:hypothetical protein
MLKKLNIKPELVYFVGDNIEYDVVGPSSAGMFAFYYNHHNLESRSGDIFRQIAKDWKLKVIDFRLSQADPSDLLGFPYIDQETKRSDYYPPKAFPLEYDPVPEGYKGWLLFFDEANAAPMAIQAASYKIMLDRMIGQYKLHKQVAIACAGNLETDRAITNRLSTAMQSRLIHLKLAVDKDQWIEWAYKNKIDHRIISFIQFKPELLHKFDPKHSDNTFPCPRTWHFLSRLIHKQPQLQSKLALVIGTVGEGPAYEFTEFCKIFDKLPSTKQILANPESVKVPDEPSILYAISGLVATLINKNNIAKLFSIINQMPAEFQVITLQNTIRENRELFGVPEVQNWMATAAKELL